MSPQSTTFSLLTIASLFSSSIALPFDIPQILPRQASFSVVNVDGSSSPTTTSAVPTVTTTVSAVSISTFTPPASTFIATVNVDRGSTTETVYITVTPTSSPTPHSTTSTSSKPDFAGPPPPPYFHPYPAVNTTTNTTSTTPTMPLTTEPCEETPEDGAPWRHSLPYPTGTGAAYPTAYPTGGYNAPVAARPSGMSAPLPVLPVNDGPYWFNSTEVPSVRKRIIVS